jgi:hypothetical protein
MRFFLRRLVRDIRDQNLRGQVEEAKLKIKGEGIVQKTGCRNEQVGNPGWAIGKVGRIWG